jgi:hypothetical protein
VEWPAPGGRLRRRSWRLWAPLRSAVAVRLSAARFARVCGRSAPLPFFAPLAGRGAAGHVSRPLPPETRKTEASSAVVPPLTRRQRLRRPAAQPGAAPAIRLSTTGMLRRSGTVLRRRSKDEAAPPLQGWHGAGEAQSLAEPPRPLQTSPTLLGTPPVA